MQARYRLYRRSNRSSGTYYAQDSTTGARESLGTKSKAEAEKLLQARNLDVIASTAQGIVLARKRAP